MRKIIITVITVALVMITSISLAQTTDLVKFKQGFAGDYSITYQHKAPKVTWQGIYSSRGLLILGAGPSLSFKLGRVGISTTAEADVTLNLKDNQFPVSAYTGQILVIGSIDNWSLFTRTAPSVSSKSEKSISGTDFIGYRIKSYTLKVLSEWRGANNGHTIYLGPSVDYRVGRYSVSTYIGMDTESPHSKTGWLEIIVALK